MKWVTAISDERDTDVALERVVTEIREGLAGEDPQLATLFASAEHASEFADLPARVAAELSSAAIVGCSGGGVIGGGAEIERRPGLVLAAACLPGVTVTSHRLGAQLPATPPEWH